MVQTQASFEKNRRFSFSFGIWTFVAGLTLGIGLNAGAAVGGEAQGGQSQMELISVGQIFTFLFLMLGPFKIIGPFARITQGADILFVRRLALRAILFSSFALLLAAFAGERFIMQFDLSIPVLALTAGIVLFLVALQAVLQQFTPQPGFEKENIAPALDLAISPMAFPTIVTPYGIATLIVFIALSPDIVSKLIIGLILLVIMLLDLVAMFLARRILKVMGVFLQILGAVLGIIQVALGLRIILFSLQKLWG